MSLTKYQRKYKKTHNKEERARSKAWRVAHPDYHREYSKNHPRDRSGYLADYRARTADERHRKWKIYYQKNKERLKENRRRKKSMSNVQNSKKRWDGTIDRNERFIY